MAGNIGNDGAGGVIGPADRWPQKIRKQIKSKARRKTKAHKITFNRGFVLRLFKKREISNISCRFKYFLLLR